MNKPLIERMVRVLEGEEPGPEGFVLDLGRWGGGKDLARERHCCLAGLAMLLSWGYFSDPGHTEGCACRVMGLDWLQARQLFNPPERVMRGATPADAASTLRHLLATGGVSWYVRQPSQGEGVRLGG